MSISGQPTFDFPHPELTKIDGPPSFVPLQKLNEELFANASSVYSARGNGALGHAVLVLGVAEYNRVANLPAGGNANNWQAPAHPGIMPNIPAGATNAMIANITATHKAALQEYITYQQVENALKRQLLACVDDTYVCSLKEPRYGYANITTRQIIEHLEATYAVLDQEAMSANLRSLQQPWEPQVSMESLWQRGTTAQQVATAGGNPINDATLLLHTREVLVNTGVFKLDLRDWDNKPVAQRTWANFKTFFTEANKKRIKETTAGQFQHGAFAATERTSPTRFSPLTLESDQGNEFSYCWTHGLTNNKEHTSKTCTKKATGHQEDATLGNMMGGNNTIRRKRGEKNKFRELNPQPARPQPRRTSNPRDRANHAQDDSTRDDETVATSNSSFNNGNGGGANDS
jgi:hypothetical protein